MPLFHEQSYSVMTCWLNQLHNISELFPINPLIKFRVSYSMHGFLWVLTLINCTKSFSPLVLHRSYFVFEAGTFDLFMAFWEIKSNYTVVRKCFDFVFHALWYNKNNLWWSHGHFSFSFLFAMAMSLLLYLNLCYTTFDLVRNGCFHSEWKQEEQSFLEFP